MSNKTESLKEDIQELVNQILIKTANLPEEDGNSDLEYCKNVRAILETLSEVQEDEDDYEDSYYDSGCTDY
jgi:hypothetical protein